MARPVFGYWNVRGLGEPIRVLLIYLGVDFEEKRYEFTDTPPTFNSEKWLEEKFTHGLEFPNLPYWKDGDFRLTESFAILKYIAKKYGKNLVPETAEGEAKAEMVMGVVHDLQTMIIHLAYQMTTPHDQPIEERTAPSFNNLVKFLDAKQWIMGDQITYVDFYLYEVLKEYTKFRSDYLKDQPALELYIQRFEALPQVSEYLKSIDGAKKCFSPFANPWF